LLGLLLLSFLIKRIDPHIKKKINKNLCRISKSKENERKRMRERDRQR